MAKPGRRPIYSDPLHQAAAELKRISRLHIKHPSLYPVGGGGPDQQCVVSESSLADGFEVSDSGPRYTRGI